MKTILTVVVLSALTGGCATIQRHPVVTALVVGTVVGLVASNYHHQHSCGLRTQVFADGTAVTFDSCTTTVAAPLCPGSVGCPP
jgi:ABC-type uncharacterized transport system permease subunit